MNLPGSSDTRPPSHGSPAKFIAVVLVVAIAAIAGVRFYAGATEAPKASAARLARIVGPHRLARARVSGGFAYAKCAADSAADHFVRGLTCHSPARSTWSSAEKLGSFAQELVGTPDSVRDHVSGIWGLVWGRTGDALEDFQDAARRRPKDARVLNDLGVAYTVYAEEHDDPSALVDAFVAVDSAVRADSTLEEALFNHALLLEQLQLRVDAIAAWNRYLAIDGKSPWATEARDHIAALAPGPAPPSHDDWQRATTDSETLKRFVIRDAAGARQFAEGELGAWARAARIGDSATAHLNAARIVANAFRERTGDGLLSDGVAVIDRAIAENNSARVNGLIDGHAALELAIDASRNVKLALPALSVARTQLARAASPMALWALLFQARVRVNFDGDSSLAWLTGIRDSAPAAYISLRMAAAQYIGYIRDRKLDFAHAIASYDSALAENRTINDPEITLRAASWLADCQSKLRGRQAAWHTRYSVLVASRDYAPSIPVYSAFDYAVIATMSDAPRLALRYEDEAIRTVAAVKDPRTAAISVAYSRRRHADLLVQLKQDSLARVDIAAARAAATPLDDPKLSADISIASAHVTMYSAPAKAEAELRGVVDQYAHAPIKDEQGLSLAYLYLAQARAGVGMIDSARAAFDSATTLMQRQRASFSNLADRGAFFDAARSVIDQILAFHVEQDPRAAFEFFESTRSRVLLDELSASRPAPAPRIVLPELQRRLPKGDIVFSYAVMPRELVVWIVGHDRFEQRRVAITAPELEDLVTKFRQSVLTAAGEPDSALSGQLYRILVDSTNTLQLGANLIVIPDRWLHFVPFVALRNPSTARLIVRDYPVSYEPSATLLLSSLSETPQHFSRSSKVLAIGDPAFDKNAFQLPDLPSADGEARRIASLYGDQSALVGKDATDTALETLAPKADIIHFAGHAVVGRDAPELSHLVLASDGNSDGAVFSTEIAQWRLKRTRLVVLSACRTADGKLSATEGASSLARAFFAAGVPAVVSSFWPVEDDDTADFFVSFHNYLVAGHSPAVALHEAQIKWLTGGDGRPRPARSWAAFQLFGRS